MNNIYANRCDCCKEIWNKNNLKMVAIEEHKMAFCPDCFTEYQKTKPDTGSIVNEIRELAKFRSVEVPVQYGDGTVYHGKDVSKNHGNPVMRDEIEKDVSQLIDKYRKFRQMASTNRTAYDDCKSIMKKIKNLREFSEKYLGYKITIETDHKGNQYVPDDILDFNISDQNKSVDEKEIEEERGI